MRPAILSAALLFALPATAQILPDPGPDPEPAYGAHLARLLLRHLDR